MDQQHASSEAGSGVAPERLALEAAKARYAAIVAARPDDAEAWCTLSSINGMLGCFAEASECCRRAVDLQPDLGEAHLNLGNVLSHEGRLKDAEAAYRTALDLMPGHAGVCLNLAGICTASDRFSEALAFYRTALQRGGEAAAGELRTRAVGLRNAGRLMDAAALLELMCDLRPDDADSWQLLATVHGRASAMEAAARCARRALAIAPGHRDAHVSLGHVLFQQGHMDDAADAYLRALDTDPSCVPALNNLGRACIGDERFGRYLAAYRTAIAAAADPTPLRTAFIGAMEDREPADYDPWLDEELQRCFAMDGTDRRTIARTAAILVRLKYGLTAADASDAARIEALIGYMAHDRLLTSLLGTTMNIDAELETVLAAARRALLAAYDRCGKLEGPDLEAAAVLARQGFINEHVYAVTPDERRRVTETADYIERHATDGRQPDGALIGALVVYGMYEAPYTLPCWLRLAQLPLDWWPLPLQPWIVETLHDRRDEDRELERIPSFAPIRHGTSQLVRSQYEENPYPRWHHIPEVQPTSLRDALQRRFPHVAPPEFLDGPVHMLVAGCGTGKQPIRTALTFPRDVTITAVDISRRSLAYAARMARRHGVDNIEFWHGDILELGRLDRRFHVIECGGVLHHMEDPLEGWRALTGLLVDGGLMSIGLYSRVARRNLAPLQEIVKREALPRDREAVRGLRRRIMDGEAGPLRLLSYDFYSTSGCRDLLFHFMEHQYTPLELDGMMKALELEFMGFVPRDAGTVEQYRRHFPHDTTLTDLASWQSYEEMYPHTFAKMYQFWCRKT